ncbi:uncharacterized protein LOC123533510 [Mercenaria mercenaria]|uniref:uncharacterized protein LOC123533510 n=1 Tax=Mercenaria mercenaria TaxID=6596 RepID=UPI001E1DA022|nr:uncharacterized protein LOC123533510 [Mercenaria mercenaria]
MPPMPPLPASRVQESCAFPRSGVDYLGPLLVKTVEGPKKVWLCLFSCMVTRAVHLEVIQDMTSNEQNIGSHMENVTKCAVICVIYWDKLAFHGGVSALDGGFYERLVGFVKRALRKTLGRKMLTLFQMQTLIKEVEAVVNSRPLVYVCDDVNSDITLTPSHFLTPNHTQVSQKPVWTAQIWNTTLTKVQVTIC